VWIELCRLFGSFVRMADFRTKGLSADAVAFFGG
jgi:hypothetical protein